MLATEIRSLTQGKGEFAMEFTKYMPVRPETQAKLMEEHNPSKKKEVKYGRKK